MSSLKDLKKICSFTFLIFGLIWPTFNIGTFVILAWAACENLGTFGIGIWVNYKGSGLEIRCMGRRPRCGPGSTSLPRGVSMSIHWPHPGGFWGARRSERSERSLLRAKEMSLLVYPVCWLLFGVIHPGWRATLHNVGLA